MKTGASSKGFLQLVSANMVTKVFGLVSIGVFTRFLTKDELAFLPVYGMLAGLSNVLFGLGLQPTIIRKLPALLENDRPGAGWLIRECTKILLAGTLLFACGVLLAAVPLAERLLGTSVRAPLIRLVAVGGCCFALRNIFHYLLWSASRFDKISIVRMICALGRTVLGVGGLLVGGLMGLAVGFVVNDAVALLLAFLYSRDLLQIRPGAGPSRLSLLRESLPFYFESYLTYFRNQGDDWIVATTLGPVVMGVYYVAKRFPTLLMMFMESLDKVITTDLSRRRGDPEAVGKALNELVPPVVTLAVPGIFMVIGLLPAMIEVVAGPGFEAAIIPAMILCLMQLIRIISVTFNRGVFVLRPPLTRVMITTVESAFLIVSLFLFVPLFAVLGVALSRLIAALAMLLGSFLVLRKHVWIHFPWAMLAKSAFISAAMAATVLLGIHVDDDLLFAPLFALAGVAVFFLLTWMIQAESFIWALEKMLPFRLPMRIQRLMRRD